MQNTLTFNTQDAIVVLLHAYMQEKLKDQKDAIDDIKSIPYSEKYWSFSRMSICDRQLEQLEQLESVYNAYSYISYLIGNKTSLEDIEGCLLYQQKQGNKVASMLLKKIDALKNVLS